MQTFPNDYFLVYHLKIVFKFLHELKQRSGVTSLESLKGRLIQTLLRE